MNDRFYSLLKTPADGCENIAHLWSWSLNYDSGKGPATLFLDLIGWSEDELGEPLYSLQGTSLGYVELSHLRDALNDYLRSPERARDFIAALMSAEMGDDGHEPFTALCAANVTSGLCTQEHDAMLPPSR
jgi:hypothetical protein